MLWPSNLVEQEDMSSCCMGTCVFLLDGNECTRRARQYASLLSEALFIFDAEVMPLSSYSTRRHLYSLDKKTCLLVQQEEISSASRRHLVAAMNLEGMVDDLRSTTLGEKFQLHLVD